MIWMAGAIVCVLLLYALTRQKAGFLFGPSASEDAELRDQQVSSNYDLWKDKLQDFKDFDIIEVNHRKSAAAFSIDGARLAFAAVPHHRAALESDLQIIFVSNIKSISTDARVIEVSTPTTQTIAVQVEKRKSAGGRALVGGVLLGPVGAIAGAASGLNGTKTVTKFEKRTTNTYETYLAPAHLMVIMNDSARTSFRIVAKTDQDTFAWEKRLLSTLDI
jgi:hypothetical protein